MYYFILIVVGLAFGSFINALVWRIHESTEKRSNINVLHGRSICMQCRHVLAPRDLIPLVSYLRLKGKCRYCQAAIPDTPLTELLLPVLYVISYTFWPYSFSGSGTALFFLWLAALVVLVALLLYDIKWMILPDKLVTALAVLAAGMLLIFSYESGFWGSLVPAAFAAVSIGGLFHVLHLVSGGKWIGGGDVKLGYVIGLLVVHPPQALMVVFLASLLGVLFALPQLLQLRVGLMSKIPFGPFLIAATIIIFLFGNLINDWFARILLIS